MKLQLITLFILLSAAINLSAQDVITKQSHGQTTFYYITQPYTSATLQPIFDSLQTHDTLYLPAANFAQSASIHLKTGAVIVGAGADPDSTVITSFSDWLVFDNGSDDAEIHGVDLRGAVHLTNTPTDIITGLKFYGCKFDNILGPSGTLIQVYDLFFKSCIIHSFFVNGTSTINIEGSFINTLWGGGANALTVRNCIIGANWQFNQNANIQDVIYENNIILYKINNVLSVSEHSTFNNNAWILDVGGSLAFTSNVTSQQNNKYWNHPNDVFDNWYDVTDYVSFSFLSNLHVINPTADTMGTNHTQVGRYGGQYQWKEGMVPFNPHWIGLMVANNTNNAFLGLNLGASAQEPNISKIKALRYWSDQSNPPIDMRYLNLTPARVIDYRSFIDLCSSSYSGATRFYYQLQDNLGNYSVVKTSVPTIATGAPSSVTIYDNGTGLQSDAPYGNQWYIGGVLISGATDQYYTPTQNGSFTCVVTNSCGSATSNAIAYTSTGITELAIDPINLYPNPNTGSFTLKLNDVSAPYELTITNTLGEQILLQPITMKETPISLNAASGVYLAALRNGSHSFSQKIILTH